MTWRWRRRALRAIGRFGPAVLLVTLAIVLVAAAIALVDRLGAAGLFGSHQ